MCTQIFGPIYLFLPQVSQSDASHPPEGRRTHELIFTTSIPLTLVSCVIPSKSRSAPRVNTPNRSMSPSQPHAVPLVTHSRRTVELSETVVEGDPARGKITYRSHTSVEAKHHVGTGARRFVYDTRTWLALKRKKLEVGFVFSAAAIMKIKMSVF